MRKRTGYIILYIILFVLTIYNFFSYSFCDYGKVNAETPKIEVLIEGIDEQPKGKIIGACGFYKGN